MSEISDPPIAAPEDPAELERLRVLVNAALPYLQPIGEDDEPIYPRRW